MRVSVVAAAVLAAASLFPQPCHAGSTALPGSDGVQSPGLSTDLPGSHLGDLPSSFSQSSSLALTSHNANGSEAMLEVLKDPSVLAAAPGTRAHGTAADAPRLPVREMADSAAAPPGSAAPGESAGLPVRGPVGDGSSPSPVGNSGGFGDLRTEASTAPRALISSNPGDRTQDALDAASGLLSARAGNAPQAGTSPLPPGESAAGAGRAMEDGGLFSSQVAIPFSSMNGARGAGRSPAPGTGVPDAAGGPALRPGAFPGLVAPLEKPAASSNRFYAYGLAFIALSVAPFAVGFLRRRQV